MYNDIWKGKDMIYMRRRNMILALAVLIAVFGVVFLQNEIWSQAADSKASAVSDIEVQYTSVVQAEISEQVQKTVSTVQEQIQVKIQEEEATEAAPEEEPEQTEETEETSALILADVWDGGNYYNVDGNLETPDMNAIMGNSIMTAEQLAAYFIAHGQSYPSYYAQTQSSGATTLDMFCQIVIEEASAEGVRPEVVFMQTMKETGWLKFGGDVSIEQYNFAGIGAVGGGAAGASFADVRTGIRAQVQHLKAYASEEPLNNDCVDPRFDYVARASSPYIEWLGIQENPNGGGWAAGAGYGGSIVSMIRELNNL